MKRKFSFNKKEWWTLIATSIVTAFILSWRLWGDKEFSFNAGMENLAKYAIASFIALIVHFYVQKWYATKKGYTTEYRWNPFGIFIVLILAVIFDGIIPFIAPGYLTIKSLPRWRVGKWKYRPYFRDYGYIAYWGIVANLILATITALIFPQYFVKLIWANIAVAVFSLIPAPFYDGFHIFFASIYQFTFMVIFTLAYASLFYYVGIIPALIAGLVLGLIGFLFVFSKKS